MCTTINVNQANAHKLPTLRIGSQGEAVKSLQQFLSKLGYYFGDTNGYFCSCTEKSVRAFQTKIGISSDGIVNRRTWKAIYRIKNFLGF